MVDHSSWSSFCSSPAEFNNEAMDPFLAEKEEVEQDDDEEIEDDKGGGGGGARMGWDEKEDRGVG